MVTYLYWLSVARAIVWKKLYLNFEGFVFLVTMVTKLYYYLSVARGNLRTAMQSYIFIT